MGAILYWTVALSALDLLSAYQPAPGVNSLQPQSYNHKRNAFHADDPRYQPTQSIRHGSVSADSEQVYEPREDPRMFYLSDVYLNGPNPVNHEVAAVYPGRRSSGLAGPDQPRRYRMFRGQVKQKGSRPICVRCPRDRTLRVAPDLRGVLLRRPRLLSCSGLHVHRNVHYVHVSGPRFGSLLGEGTHTVNGRIVFHNNTVQDCQMRVFVTAGGCATPRHLASRCNDGVCSFSCRDSRLRLRGESRLRCHEDTWSGILPTCHVQSWCKLPQPPVHGDLSCQASDLLPTQNSVLAEGSKCRVRCDHGWRSARPYSIVCKRGYWTKQLSCVPKH